MPETNRIPTTIWFDPDVDHAMRQEKAVQRGISFSDLVNDSLRAMLDLPPKESLAAADK